MELLKLSKTIKLDASVAASPNLCDRFDADDLTQIGNLVHDGYARDKQSRSKWEKRTDAALDMALQIQREKTFPWPGASNVVFPLVTIAALQFSARSYGNIINGTDVVKYRVVGDDPTGDLRKKADRIATHMSWQVLEEDQSWEEQHDRLLINLGIVGCNFVKTYFSSSVGHNVSELVMARDLVLDYYAKSVEAAARKTHVVPLFRNEIYEKIMNGTFCDVRDEGWFNSQPTPSETSANQDNRQGVTAPQPDEDTPFLTLEQHRNLDLDGDGYAEPYIVTIEEGSFAVLRIVARWDDDKDVERNEKGDVLRIKATEYFTKYSFIPAPDGGIYDVGFGVLLGPLNEAVNSGINQLLDSGTMQNSMGGFLGRGTKIRGGVYTMAPWEWKRVDSSGDDLRKNMVPFPERAPSTVMFQLLGLLIQYTDRIAGTVEQMVGENPGQNTPAETSRNTMEQGMQVYAMIFKRVWRSMKEEFKKLHKLNATFLPVKQNFGAGNSEARREDYRGDADMVVPVADPNITSMAQRVGKAMAIAQRAMSVPGYDPKVVEKRVLQAMQIDGIDEVYPGPDKTGPLPNFKVQIEQLKQEGTANKLKYELQRFALELQETKRLNNALIAKHEAEALKLMADAKDDQMNTRLEAVKHMISGFKEYNDAIDDRFNTIQGALGNATGAANGGGAGGMEGGSGNAGVLPAPAGVPGGSQGAVGAGSIQ